MRVGRMVAIGVAFLSVLAVAAARDVSLKQGDNDGVVVIGLVSGHDDRFRLRFARYVTETGKVSDSYFSGRVTIEHQEALDQMVYYALPFNTGTHVFKSIHADWAGQENVFCLGNGTFAFDVRAGEALYLGDYSVYGGGRPRKPLDPALEGLRKEFKDSIIFVPSLTRLPDNLGAAEAALAQHPGVTVALAPSAVREVKFSSGRNSCG